MSAKELLTADEAALLLKATRRTILRWAGDRKIESVRVSKKVILFIAEAIESFLRAKTLEVEPAAAIKPRSEIRSAKSQLFPGLLGPELSSNSAPQNSHFAG